MDPPLTSPLEAGTSACDHVQRTLGGMTGGGRKEGRRVTGSGKETCESVGACVVCGVIRLIENASAAPLALGLTASTTRSRQDQNLLVAGNIIKSLRTYAGATQRLQIDQPTNHAARHTIRLFISRKLRQQTSCAGFSDISTFSSRILCT